MKKNNVFLAHLVSFSRNSLLFRKNDLEENFATEEYRLVELRDNLAYDLITYKRLYIITNAMDLIDDRVIDKLQPNVLYVYKLWDIIDMWEDVKRVYGIKEEKDTFLEKALDVVDELDTILNPQNKVIDIQKVKKIMTERK